MYSQRQTSVSEHEVGHLGAERAERLLDDPVVVVGAGADVVLLLGDPEEEHRADPEPLQRSALHDELVDRASHDPREPRQRLGNALARTHEERKDEIGERDGVSRTSARSAAVRRNLRGG